jgi:LmbE family N-acetylglucosaminyl deacetylase
MNIHRSKRLVKNLKSPKYLRVYLVASLVILFLSTVFWSYLGARIQLNNSDQLVNGYLFEHLKTLQQASLPGQHSFLLKWPIFWLLGAIGLSSTTYIISTIVISLISVALFTAILYRIEKRPLIFTTLCLALSSVLLVIPAQAYPGGLLPVNMAMITTRNLEYVFFIFGLIFFANSTRIRNRNFVYGVLLMSLVIASDKLYLTLSLGGSLLSIVTFSLLRRWKQVSMSVIWLVGSSIAVLIGSLILWLINISKITHIVGQGTASPYNAVQNVHDMILGIVYSLTSLFTNYGANPAANTTVIKDIPSHSIDQLFSLGGPAYIINTLILLTILLVVYKFIRKNIVVVKKSSPSTNLYTYLSIMLISTSIVAVGSFIFTNHYYAGDARYLGICLFAGFITLATFYQKKKIPVERNLLVVAVLFIGILFGFFAAIRNYQQENAASSPINSRNQIISQVLNAHHVNALVGDYWRVLPIRPLLNDTAVTPLSDCTSRRQVLSSKAWQPNLYKHSFAYLISYDNSLTDYPKCTLDQVVLAYGRPNSSQLISGSLHNPKEQLLIYDYGIYKPKNEPARQPASVVPITLDQLNNTICSGPTIMNFVAHEDDDLLFMNPDLIHSIKVGNCIRTVYLTAGDAGNSAFYYLSREQGSEAAYSEMTGTKYTWVQRLIKIGDNQFIKISSPRENNKISLIFISLPDGNTKGEGFSSTQYQSIAKLFAKNIYNINAIDNQSSYTSEQLINSLTLMLHAYQPSEIRTQANLVKGPYPDHSDHMAVGRFVKLAYSKYETEQYNNQVVIPIKYYQGYTIHSNAVNVSGLDLQQKEAAWFAYSKNDPSTCSNIITCAKTVYIQYLPRQYQNSY